jgi:hypothetical protein
MLQLAECFLRGTGEVLLIDQASRSLLEETAAALHALTAEIVLAVASPEVDGMIQDEALKSNLRLAARSTNSASQKNLQQIQVRCIYLFVSLLFPHLLDPPLQLPLISYTYRHMRLPC